MGVSVGVDVDVDGDGDVGVDVLFCFSGHCAATRVGVLVVCHIILVHFDLIIF